MNLAHVDDPLCMCLIDGKMHGPQPAKAQLSKPHAFRTQSSVIVHTNVQCRQSHVLPCLVGVQSQHRVILLTTTVQQTVVMFDCCIRLQRSVETAVGRMSDLGLDPAHSRVYFGQLLGMSDHLTQVREDIIMVVVFLH